MFLLYVFIFSVKIFFPKQTLSFRNFKIIKMVAFPVGKYNRIRVPVDKYLFKYNRRTRSGMLFSVFIILPSNKYLLIANCYKFSFLCKYMFKANNEATRTMFKVNNEAKRTMLKVNNEDTRTMFMLL